jgi:energy-coupling factor transporter ATP-binding protein EcfA2
MWPAIALIAAFVAFSVWSSWDARRKLIARLGDRWGLPRSDTPDLENVADFFREHPADGALDDRTWTDLLMDDVFAHLDRTESRVGQQMLYRRLRGAGPPQSLDAFEVLVARFSDDMAFRAQTQSALVRLSHSSVYYLHRLVRPDTLNRPWWYAVFPVWTVAILTTLILGVVWHGLFVFAIFGLIVNVAIRVMTNRRVGSEAVWFRQVGPLMSVARALAACETPATAAITGGMAADRAALRRLGAIARWVSRGNDAGASTDLIGALIEYINIQLLMDVNALYFASRELRTRGAHFVRLIEAVGDIDAAIAVASFRASAAEWVRPRFVAPQMPAVLTDLRHPLVDDAVPNSIALAPPHGVLITGSNMSGKSTFLRTVGVNAVLAQTIHTCLAGAYEAPLYRVRSCIGREDDLVAGKSYYLVEVESVLSLVAASGRNDPHLFIFDELFRGTNAVERIAAGEAVLRALAEGGQPHVVLAATHDGELVELLHDSYVVFHLGDAIGPGGLSFDYRLTPGPATSRNAIALLKLNGAPASLVEHALSRAAELDRRRAATTSGH